MFFILFGFFVLAYAWWAYRGNRKRIQEEMPLTFSEEESEIVFRQNLLLHINFGAFAIIFMGLAFTDDKIALGIAFLIFGIVTVICQGYVLASTFINGATMLSMGRYWGRPRKLDRTEKLKFLAGLIIATTVILSFLGTKLFGH